ncbi:MAG TPA: twin-arginine translocase subunit TatB [Gammaproteobacteria bacterium]|nr:twin-arginine translocase subunit TatB [Gammaproteobacteria bacterium]
MFDVSFWEISIVAIIALLVIGPERLPTVARTAGRWYGKLQRFVTSVKEDIERELKATELQQIMDEQKNELDRLKRSLDETRSELERMTSIERMEEEIKPVEKKPDENLPAASGSTPAHTDSDSK